MVFQEEVFPSHNETHAKSSNDPYFLHQWMDDSDQKKDQHNPFPSNLSHSNPDNSILDSSQSVSTDSSQSMVSLCLMILSKISGKIYHLIVIH